MLWIADIFVPLTYVALVAALLLTTRRWRDWITPLSLIFALGLVRFGLPGLLLLCGVDPDVPVFRTMRLDEVDWTLGHVLALLGLLGVAIGWHVPSRSLGIAIRQTSRRLRVHLTRGVRYTAAAGMCIGIVALLAFVATNISIGQAVQTGEFRGTEIQEGTGVFFWLSLMLIASSVVFSAYLVATYCAWWIALLPVSLATLLFWTLGGRVRALTPIAAGLFFLWHWRGRPGSSIKTGMILAIALLPAFLLAGQLYRGGQGLEGITNALSIDAVSDYVKGAIWVDWGQLHALAGAAAIDRPGVLGGGTFWRTLLWPLSERIIPISGRSAGVFITDTLVGFGGGRKWGFHSTLIGDAYLNFGLGGLFVVTALFGVLTKRLYLGWKQGSIDSVFYTIALLYSARIFFESIEKFPEAMVVLVFALAVTRVGQVTFRPSVGSVPGDRSAARQSPLVT